MAGLACWGASFWLLGVAVNRDGLRFVVGFVCACAVAICGTFLIFK
jgi:hypothetical protein